MSADRSKLPWRFSTQGVSIALRVTPRGGRDEIDGIETLADGRSVVKVRVRAIAEGGAANRAVTELLASALGVPRARIRLLSGGRSTLRVWILGIRILRIRILRIRILWIWPRCILSIRPVLRILLLRISHRAC